MKREAVGHVAAAILRQVNAMARISDQDREKTIIIAESITATDWASITFVGQCHRLCLRIEGAAGPVAAGLARITADIAEADIPLPGHFIAEIRVVASAPPLPGEGDDVVQQLTIEALVLRD